MMINTVLICAHMYVIAVHASTMFSRITVHQLEATNVKSTYQQKLKEFRRIHGNKRKGTYGDIIRTKAGRHCDVMLDVNKLLGLIVKISKYEFTYKNKYTIKEN